MLSLPLVFEKLGISFPFWSELYILNGTRLQNDIWKTLRINSSFVYIYMRCPFCLCAEGIQPVWWLSWLPSCSNRRSGQGMCSLTELFLDWSTGWPMSCMCCTGSRRVDSLAACVFFPAQGQPWRNRGERELLNCKGCYLLASRNGFRNGLLFLTKYWQVTKS